MKLLACIAAALALSVAIFYGALQLVNWFLPIENEDDWHNS